MPCRAHVENNQAIPSTSPGSERGGRPRVRRDLQMSLDLTMRPSQISPEDTSHGICICSAISVGAVVLHNMLNRKVVLYPDNTVVKSGKRIAMGEADALRVAALAGIPVPAVHDTHTTPDGQKRDIARQLRVIVDKMRYVVPPQGLISACDGREIRDTRVHFTYHSPPCHDEKAFNEFLLSGLYEDTPSLVREALSRRLRTNHHVVFTHCDLTPRNILVQDGKIQGLVDWEDSGWYPEYWEYVKFFQRTADKDWKQYAEDIFPELYHDELVEFMAISKWQNS
ncbi:hypothetical protein LCI18_005896 [Fusarium solani-melongenae]|uniref:Uncharacterized protein n=1 Tax=Fusarium solani subsp. cucurbitae TaxID=2747967 RepID=A0ACD3Z1A1_FUSSC|nr:hypothetical protein LCI18_005896 [Fusarium solani-melongenae]